ncbi:MAG: hypothetical protein IPL79_14590 [Myxococcales bacterium]|nr:hypothetical protein [Myxococcales bacterium]
MAAFHLFIEGVATTPGTDATQVAAAVGARFGIDGSEIARRLAAGRFRVKGNVDYATACSFRIELERLGVRCAIIDAATDAVVTAPPLPASMATAKPAAMTAAPVPAALSTNPVAPANTGQYQSGLAAAFGGGNMNVGDEAMGALATGAFRLTALDKNSDADDGGDDDVTTFDNQPATLLDTAPSPEALPALTLLAPPPVATATPAPPRPAAAPPPRPNPNAAFAPPSEAGEAGEQALTLLVDVRAEKKQAAQDEATRTKSHMMAVATPSAHDAAAAATLAPAAAPSPQIAVRKALAAALAPNPRWAIGVLLAMFLGFALASGYASGKERAAFAAVDARLVVRQAAVVTPTEWDELDAYRATELAAKDAAQRNIAQSAAVVWLLLSIAFGAAWHFAVPWTRVLDLVADRGGSKS